MADLASFLRDFRSAALITIDVRVIDFLAAVIDAIGAHKANILSAYRTPETNAMLKRTTFGLAENSQHLYGRAIDVSFESNLTEAVKAARAMKRGGVGWYPHSGFMHIDTGPVRNWDLEGRGFGSLLLNSRRSGHYDRKTSARDRGLASALEGSGQLTPELQRSGQLQPGLEHTSRLLRLR